MITRNDIKEYFDLEAEASKNKWEALMKLPVKERIHKCRAIQSVYLNRDYHKFSDDGFIPLKSRNTISPNDRFGVNEENCEVALFCRLAGLY